MEASVDSVGSSRKIKRHSGHGHKWIGEKPRIAMFSKVKGRLDMARLQLILTNIDDKPMKYKVKIKQGCTVTVTDYNHQLLISFFKQTAPNCNQTSHSTISSFEFFACV
ncbi:unnamed protein product [Anisakis simplex]|uniref:Rad60-SLD domain-containing protein n=1 Tax=Anisakis simplex TaxID=6269 RepID=A0A0M3J3F0_ANISI|nr:unnamed protein product [Anisakis simplex]